VQRDLGSHPTAAPGDVGLAQVGSPMGNGSCTISDDEFVTWHTMSASWSIVYSSGLPGSQDHDIGVEEGDGPRTSSST
jgi:hypothetical protein